MRAHLQAILNPRASARGPKEQRATATLTSQYFGYSIPVLSSCHLSSFVYRHL